MDRRTVIVFATLAACFFCGCPGLFVALLGGMTSIISFIPGARFSTDQTVTLATGLGSCCLGLTFVIVPLVVAFFIFRRLNSTIASDDVSTESSSEI